MSEATMTKAELATPAACARLAVELGSLDVVYARPAPRTPQADPFKACTCFTADWGQYADMRGHAPATVPTACGWCQDVPPVGVLSVYASLRPALAHALVASR